VLSYTVLRSTGSTFTLTGLKTYNVAGSNATSVTFVDPEKLQNKQAYTYVVKATLADSGGGTSGASNPVTIIAQVGGTKK
jgi:hypothetical protein